MTTQPSAVPIAPTDRVSDVLKRDESLVDVFVQHAPHFSKLRNKAMRRVMARLITVEQAARTAGISADVLLRDLNAALGITVPDAATGPGATANGSADAKEAGEPRGGASTASPTPTPTPTRPPDAPVVEIDVREDLRSGNEPFSKIMAAVGALNAGEVLRLRATFEPVPLFAVLSKRGFVHESLEHAGDDWSVWFWRPAPGSAEEVASSASKATEPERSARPGAASEAAAATTQAATAGAPDADGAAAAASNGDERIVYLDVREFGPPEPLLRTLAALEKLPDGHELIQINARVPQFLIPMLAERGYACEVDESHADRVLVRIWRAT